MEPQVRTGTAVERYLFSPLYTPSSAWAVVRWWERRRLFYNLSVGAAGLVTVATAFLLSWLPPSSGQIGPPLILVPIYGIMANIFYSLGAPVDLLLRRRLGDQAGPVAQAVFRYGYAFSIGLTLLPIPLMLIGWVLTILSR
jgi:hypothetical protein